MARAALRGQTEQDYSSSEVLLMRMYLARGIGVMLVVPLMMMAAVVVVMAVVEACLGRENHF